MKNPYPLAAHLPEPLAYYGLDVPAVIARPPEPADFDRIRADSQIAGLGLLTALLVDDPEQYRMHVDNLDLTPRDQILGLADIAPFVCRHQEVVDFLAEDRPATQQAALLVLFAMTAVHAGPRRKAPNDQQLEAARAIASILEEQPYDELLPAVQRIATETCSPDHLDRFGDAVADDDTPLTY